MSRDEMSRAVYASFSRGMEAPTLTDFEEGLRALNVDAFSQETIRHIFEMCDRNNDGRLSSHEFRGLCDVYPKFIECLFHRLNDRRARDIQEEAIHQASQQAETVYTKKEAMLRQLEAATQRLKDSEEALAEESKRLEEERQREADARVKDAAERVDQVSSRQADQVASALDKQAKGVCAEKKEQFYSTLSEADIAAFAEKLAVEWRKKEGDVVDELIENLKVPETVHSKLAVVAEAAKHLHQTKGEAYPCRNRVELLIMTLYTMAGPDIDALVTYESVPVYDEEDREPWTQYNEAFSRERNGAIFSTINWAMRTAADPMKTESKDGVDAWAACCKWVKYIGLLMYVCSQIESEHTETGAELARGLAGLPPNVLDAHKAMLPNDSLCWPAASSCAFDRQVSESYIRGDAANATKTGGSSILFLLSNAKCGASLQQISKYPKESEMLLPPFSTFRIGYQDVDATLPGTCVINMSCDGHAIPSSWLSDLGSASHRSAERLQTALVTHAEGALRERQSELERQKQRERQAGSDVLKTEREVDRQKNRLVMSQQDAKRAEDRLRELQKLLEEQHAEVTKQHDIVQKNTQELNDAESMCEAATYDKELAARSVQSAEETVKEAEDVLEGVKKAKEQRRMESQVRLTNAKKDTTNREKARDEATAQVNRDKNALQQAKTDLEAVANDLADAERKVSGLREESNDAVRRRKGLDAEETPILDLEMKLVMQRRALEEKEAKHYKDLRCFDEQWRPASPRSQPLAIMDNPNLGRGEHLSSPSPFEDKEVRYESQASYAKPDAQFRDKSSQPSQNELPPPRPASQVQGAPSGEPLTFSLTLLDANDAIGLVWEGSEDGSIYVKSVSSYGAAGRAGVEAGWKLMGIDGALIATREDLKLATNNLKLKKHCAITFHPQGDLQTKLEKSDEENKMKDQRIRELERRLRGTEQLEGVHLSPPRPRDSQRQPPADVENQRQPPSVQPTPLSIASQLPVGRPQSRPAGSMSAVEQIRQKMLGRDVSSPTPQVTETPVSPEAKQAEEAAAPVQETRPLYLPQSAVDNAKHKEASVRDEIKKEEVRVGRPGPPVGRPVSVASTPQAPREYPNAPSRGISPAVPNISLLAREDTGVSLERRIARLSAEVAASRERASHPRSGR